MHYYLDPCFPPCPFSTLPKVAINYFVCFIKPNYKKNGIKK
nr:MAG TPA: waglerin family protein [Caudoviricetes sp.]